jgi:sec-independent protein translocase protein TatA
MGFLRDLGGWHLLIILVIIVLLFGATRLPAVSKSIGQSVRIFRKEVKTMKDEPSDEDVAAAQPKTASNTATDDKK